MRSALALLALALASCASGPNPNDRYARLLTPTANPSKVVAAELAFARAAQDKGQWTAYREFAAHDAVIFEPGPVNAQEWLKQQTDPADAVKWQPHQVWSSCDGSLAVTKGAWQRPNGSFGYFTTVWERQRDGEYKWVMDQGEPLAVPLPAPEFIATEVADCHTPLPITVHHVSLEATNRTIRSHDQTLEVAYSAFPSGRRHIGVTIARDGAAAKVFDATVEAPGS